MALFSDYQEINALSKCGWVKELHNSLVIADLGIHFAYVRL